MAVWSRLPLSGSTNGRLISVLGTSSPGTTIHTVSTATQIKDHVYAWGCNQATSLSQITFEFGGTSTLDQMTMNIPSQAGFFPLLQGAPLIGATDIVVRAFATATNRVFIDGYVDRAT